MLKLGRPVPGTYDRRLEFNASYYDPKRAVLPYEFVAHTYSSLTFEAHVTQMLSDRIDGAAPGR